MHITKGIVKSSSGDFFLRLDEGIELSIAARVRYVHKLLSIEGVRYRNRRCSLKRLSIEYLGDGVRL